MDTLDGMRTFVASVEAGSFTAAADRVGHSNKLVSKYVAELEARLGVRLLHRTTRRLSLTEAGQRYYARCAELLRDIDHLEGSLRTGDGALLGTLRISAPVTFGELYVTPLVRRFRGLHPQITIDLRLSDRYVDLAEEGFDLALHIGNLGASSLIARRLARTELWAVASPGYLAVHPAPKDPQDLAQHTCIRDTNLRESSAWTFQVEGKMRRVPLRGGLQVNSARAVARLAAEGEGLALCPDYVAAPEVAEGRLLRVLAGYPSLTLDVHAVYLDSTHMPARVRGMLDFLMERFRGAKDWTELNG